MSNAKTTLFQLCAVADSIIVGGYSIDEVSIESFYGPEHPQLVRLTMDDVDFHFADCEVDLIDGSVTVSDYDPEGDSTPYQITFKVHKLLTAEDLTC